MLGVDQVGGMGLGVTRRQVEFGHADELDVSYVSTGLLKV